MANRRTPTDDEWAEMQRAGWQGMEREWITFPKATIVVVGVVKVPPEATKDGGVIVRRRPGAGG